MYTLRIGSFSGPIVGQLSNDRFSGYGPFNSMSWKKPKQLRWNTSYNKELGSLTQALVGGFQISECDYHSLLSPSHGSIHANLDVRLYKQT